MGRRGVGNGARILRVLAWAYLFFTKSPQPVPDVGKSRALRIALVVLLLFTTFAAGTAYASNYVYDANGRLVAVTDDSGNTVVYSYDAIGNILSIQKLTAGQLALFSFNPAQGTVNTPVTIQGNGFSTTIGNNTVKFNGTTATVTSATATQLVVKVPNGATTGPISVTVGGNTVTSTTNFIVYQPPSISSFSPAFGNPGAAVTVNGAALDPVSGSTVLTLGGEYAAITSASNTQLIFSVPSASIGSGPIHVTTPYGQATTSTDFIVVPVAIGAANVVATAQLTAGGSAKNLNINSTNKYGIFAFNASAGQWLSVQLSSLTTTPSGGTVNYYVYSPSNVQITTGTVSAASNMSIHLPKVTLSGTYLVVFASGSYTVQVTANLVVDKTVQTNGTSVSLATSGGTQSIRSAFAGTAGQNFGLGLTNLTLSAGNYVTITAYKPDGSYWTSNGCYTAPTYPSCQLPMPALPQTGTYQIIVTPQSAGATMSFNVLISPHVTGTLALNTPFNLSMANPGQLGLVTFTLASTQTVALQISGLTTTPPGYTTYFYLFGPGQWPSGSYTQYSTTNDLIVNLPNLAAGTYTLEVNTQYGLPTNATLEWTP